MRLRVISTRPSSEMSNTWVRVLSRASASRKMVMTASRFLAHLHVDEVDDDDAADVAQPELRAISSAASRLLRNTVSSRLDLPTFLPVFTSITVSASVCSMMSDPPDGSHTLRSRALWSCSWMWWRSKSGSGSTSTVVVLDPVGQGRGDAARRSRGSPRRGPGRR